MLSLRPNMWLREGGVSAHCEAGRRLFCCGPLRGGPFWIVLVYILVSVYNLFFFLFIVDRGSNGRYALARHGLDGRTMTDVGTSNLIMLRSCAPAARQRLS